MLENIASIFDKKKELMQQLKKKNYEINMKKFRNENNHFFFEMTDYVSAAENKDEAAKEIAKIFVDATEKAFAKGFRNKIPGYVQSDLNFFMIYYVFPAILMTLHDDSKLIADSLCDEWKTRFKGGLVGYTDYETLANSFKDKIFGIF